MWTGQAGILIPKYLKSLLFPQHIEVQAFEKYPPESLRNHLIQWIRIEFLEMNNMYLQ